MVRPVYGQRTGAGGGSASPGDVIKAVPTHLGGAWGLRYDGGLIVSNPLIYGGDNHNHRFTVDGEFVTKWSTAAWHGFAATDIAYDPNHELLWQPTVAGNRCLHGQDTEDGSLQEILCGDGWTESAMWGAAYRA